MSPELKTLGRALRYLAGNCDRAHDRDGYGFSAADAEIGHSLAWRYPDTWSAAQAAVAHKLARKYGRQLREAGIEVVETLAASAAVVDIDRGPETTTGSFHPLVLTSRTLVLTSQGFPGQAALAAVKAIDGRRYRPDPPRWEVPLSSVEGIRDAIAGGHLVLTPELAAALGDAERSRTETLEAAAATDAEIHVEGLGGELMTFQRAGVAYAVEHRRCWIADQMGLGKTVQALATLQALRAWPALVVVPASLKLNWEREARKWLPGVTVEVLGGRKPKGVPDAQVLVINYDVLDAWAPLLATAGIRALVLDEAHYCKSAKARRTKAARSLAKGKDLQCVLLLSGTPVVNAPIEMIPQLQILGRLEELGGWRGFTGRYCIASPWGGFERQGRNLESLNTELRQRGLFVRRTKDQVLTELPAKRRVRVPLSLAPKARREYRAVLAEVQDQIRAAREERAAAHREGREPEPWALAAAMTGVGRLRKQAASSKLEDALGWIRDRIEDGEKLVVFGHHVAVTEHLAAELEAPLIKGGISLEDRQKAVDLFQNDPACRAIVLNLRAGGVGLTLTAASNVVFVESGWTPADNDQAEDRCHRIGQDQSVTAWYLEAEDTIDQWLADLIAEKRQTVDAATEGSMLSALEERIAGPKKSRPTP